MMSNKEATVFIVEDDASMRESLQFLIESVEYQVVPFASADAFLSHRLEGGPACLVLDIRMPGMSGLELQEELARRDSELPIIFITSHGDVPTAVRALKGGAHDFLEKPINDQVLLDRIHAATIAHGEILREREMRKETSERLSSLTPRQRQVLELVAAGKQNKEISYKLQISLKTVEMHRHHLMEKLGAHTAADLTRLLFEAGAPSGAVPGKPYIP